MTLPDIFLLAVLLLLIRIIPSREIRQAAMILSSCVCIFMFQPVLPVREMDFWFPLWTVLLVLFVYAAFSRQNPLKFKKNIIDIAVILGAVLLLGATRFISYEGLVTASRPPQFWKVVTVAAAGAAAAFFLNFLTQKGHKWQMKVCTAGIILFLTVLKTPALSLSLSRIVREINGQSADLALSTDLRWFGFSYIAFRLLSILLDSLKGRKADIGLGEFFVYVCFPPALSAGPIDRWDRFCKEYSAGLKSTLSDDIWAGTGQILYGLFHKFVLADALAKMALSAQNAGQFISAGWAWAALFAYALQIYFDFSGYSEIAVGLGMLFGIHLPKNFDHPYLKGDLTKFWSSWHMTLTQWIRSYVFNPLTRALRGNKEHPLPQWLIVLITQLTTMLLIGLWHGVSVNFVIWGLWHGIGLFVHQLYSRKTGGWLRTKSKSFLKIYTAFAAVLTFLYVSLGWIWFVIPDFHSALGFFGRLFG
ncbi:MAG: MBOAT family protein [Anaerolineaceae bacterium]|nr:MBOAT family protein [Anaerolineaceae bacterium]